MNRRGAVVIFVVAALTGVRAQDGVFSSVNRMALSYEWADSVHAAIRDGRRLMLSSPVVRRSLDSAAVVTVDGGPMGRLALDVALVGAGAVAYGDGAGGILSVEGRAGYESRFVRAWVDLRVTTTDSVSGEWPREHDYERSNTGSEAPIDGFIDFGPTLVEGYLTIGGRAFSVTVGKEKLRWGPGYKGTLGMSGTAPAPMLYYHMTANIGHALRLQSFLAGFDDESIYQSEVDTVWPAERLPSGKKVSTIPARYGAGQRIDIAFGRHVQVGIYELVDFFGSSELTRFANPFQIYYASNQSSGTNAANLLAGIDFNVLLGPVRVYGEFLNDDITVFEDAGNPNKYAWMAGVQYAGRGALRLLGVEYAHVAQYVYGHPHVITRHALWGESLGWPYGNYQDHANVHAVLAFPHRIRCRAEVGVWYGGAGTLSDDWYLDGMPDLDRVPYAPQQGDWAVSALVEARWQPFRWLGVDIALRPGWRAGEPIHQAAVYARFSAPKGWAVAVNE